MANQSRNFFSVEDYTLVSQFERLRRTLLEEKNDHRLEKPLAFWALASDRRLPFAFLGRTLNDLLSTPFEELLSTPGIGQKKISSLIVLLDRATKEDPPNATDAPDSSDGNRSTRASGAERSTDVGRLPFNPAMVSEALWVQWRQTVRQHGLQRIVLGRLAPTLQSLPTVIWHTPLGEYVDLSLEDIRSLKTHGEKRVRSILEVFHVVSQVLASSVVPDHLVVDLAPRFVRCVNSWIADTRGKAEPPSADQLLAGIAEPLLAQIEIDAGPTVWRLTADRLGVGGPVRSVRDLAKRMGVTRARVYQLLEDCGKVMEVRWPEGELVLGSLFEASVADSASREAQQVFGSLTALFYPKSDPLARQLADRIKSGVASVVTQSAG